METVEINKSLLSGGGLPSPNKLFSVLCGIERVAGTSFPSTFVYRKIGWTGKKCSGTNSPSTYGLRQIRWYGKASLCTNSPSTAGLSLNRMVRKLFVWHKLSIHYRLVFMSDGGFKQECSKGPHPFFDLIMSDGGSRQERPKRPHPLSGSSKSDGAPEQ